MLSWELVERFGARLQKAGRAARNPGSTGGRWLRRCRWALTFASVTYLAALIAGLLLVQWIGERYWLFSLLLLLPPLGWLLPLAALSPGCLIVRPRLCLLHLLAAAYVLFVFMPFHWSLSARPEGEVLTILSNNAGDRRTRTLFPLVEEVLPDIILLQDASASQGGALARIQGGPLMQVVQHEHFVLVSRFPIVRSGLIEDVSYRGTPLAAWFEIDFHGKTIVIYNVHLPTPRHDLERLRGQGFLAELPRRGGIYSESVRRGYRESLRERVQAAEDLAEFLAGETRPLLAAGDFNAVAQGYVRRLFTAQLTDAFADRGKGYGFTLPGVSRNPLSFFGPWLRLDYIFAGAGFKTLECHVEGRQPAQHRAVVARFELRASNND